MKNESRIYYSYLDFSRIIILVRLIIPRYDCLIGCSLVTVSYLVDKALRETEDRYSS